MLLALNVYAQSVCIVRGDVDAINWQTYTSFIKMAPFLDQYFFSIFHEFPKAFSQIVSIYIHSCWHVQFEVWSFLILMCFYPTKAYLYHLEITRESGWDVSNHIQIMATNPMLSGCWSSCMINSFDSSLVIHIEMDFAGASCDWIEWAHLVNHFKTRAYTKQLCSSGAK